jgi:hypothetical protein
MAEVASNPDAQTFASNRFLLGRLNVRLCMRPCENSDLRTMKSQSLARRAELPRSLHVQAITFAPATAARAQPPQLHHRCANQWMAIGIRGRAGVIGR